MEVMEIAVCINRVPDTGSRIDVRNGVIETSRLNMVLNPYDEYAIEEAVRFKERHPVVAVTAFSAGGEERYDVLRKAMAMGVDKACLVENGKDDDSYVVAASLCKAIREYYPELPDLVFCGRESSDCNRAQVPLMLAEMLGFAAVSAVTKLEMHSREIKVWREIEGGLEEYVLHTPAVISAEKGLNHPRKTNVKAVVKARKQPVAHVDGSIEESPRILYGTFFSVERSRNCKFLETAGDLVRVLHEERGGL